MGFRATAREAASRYAVTGWVRNERDGTVILEAQGVAEEVSRFLEAVRATMAEEISGEDRATIEPRGEERGFEILR